MNLNLTGKVAVVTGVSRKIGIGAGIVHRLAEAGAAVFTTYYRPYDETMSWGSAVDEAQEIVAQARALDVAAESLEADLANSDAPQRIMDEARRALGPVDILVNNATCDVAADLDGISAELLDQHYAVNIRGTLLLCQAFVRQFSGGEGGRIINLTSGQSVTPMPDSIPYVTTKAAIEGLTISLSADLAPRGITVNAVDPGATDTGWMSPDLYRTLAAQSPFQRVGLPDDVARLICFLASHEGRWITGQTIRSRGGF